LVGISIENVTKFFVDRQTGHKFHAVGPVSLEVKDGEFMCLLGPSGCGKSTLLYMISDLVTLNEGKIEFIGNSNSEDSKRHSNLVFQEYGLFPWRKVLQNVMFGPEIRGVRKEEAKEIALKYIELVGLKGFENRYPHELSGGMKQRVGIARALANQPSVLLMDEPFASVDAQTRDILHFELLRIWERERKTILFVTHNIEEAIILGQRVAVFTARPGTIKQIIDIDLPRPREFETRATPKFNEIYLTILSAIKDEVLKAAKEVR
jgi:NitT/TauT family transport system ATP-binding protein